MCVCVCTPKKDGEPIFKYLSAGDVTLKTLAYNALAAEALGSEDLGRWVVCVFGGGGIQDLPAGASRPASAAEAEQLTGCLQSVAGPG